MTTTAAAPASSTPAAPARTAQGPDPSAIFEMLNAYQRSAALKAALELGLFTHIGREARSAQQLAEASGASARGIRILCDYLVVYGLLAKSGERYTLPANSAFFLDQHSPAYIGSAAKFLLHPELLAPFNDLTQVVRSGRTTMPGEGTVVPDNPMWVDFAREMAPLVFPGAQSVAALVAGDQPMRVLDIAAGHGLFGISIAQRNPQATITAVDWPAVLAVARENAAKFGVASRHRALAGDAFAVDFGGPYDLALLTNFLHHFDPPTCERLIRKVAAALAPGGRCVTIDFVPNDDRVSPPIPATFGLMMLGSTAAGDVYTFAEYERMFRAGGFARSEIHTLQGMPQNAIISYKA